MCVCPWVSYVKGVERSSAYQVTCPFAKPPYCRLSQCRQPNYFLTNFVTSFSGMDFCLGILFPSRYNNSEQNRFTVM